MASRSIEGIRVGRGCPRASESGTLFEGLACNLSPHAFYLCCESVLVAVTCQALAGARASPLTSGTNNKAFLIEEPVNSHGSGRLIADRVTLNVSDRGLVRDARGLASMLGKPASTMVASTVHGQPLVARLTVVRLTCVPRRRSSSPPTRSRLAS